MHTLEFDCFKFWLRHLPTMCFDELFEIFCLHFPTQEVQASTLQWCEDWTSSSQSDFWAVRTGEVWTVVAIYIWREVACFGYVYSPARILSWLLVLYLADIIVGSWEKSSKQADILFLLPFSVRCLFSLEELCTCVSVCGCVLMSAGGWRGQRRASFMARKAWWWEWVTS